MLEAQHKSRQAKINVSPVQGSGSEARRENLLPAYAAESNFLLF